MLMEQNMWNNVETIASRNKAKCIGYHARVDDTACHCSHMQYTCSLQNMNKCRNVIGTKYFVRKGSRINVYEVFYV